MNPKEELQSCQNFLIDFEIERARHKVFTYAVENLNETVVNGKFDQFFNNLKSAAKVNLVFGLIIKNMEDGGFRFFYVHENITLLDRIKLVCTKDDLTKLKDILNITDVIQSCVREEMITLWRFYKQANLTVFAVLLKDLPIGCKDAVLPQPLLQNGTITQLTFKKKTRQPYSDHFVPFLRLLCIYTETNDWKKKLQKFSIFSWKELMDLASICSRQSIWTIFHMLKIC